ncbi:MAG TPA: hypothetical protein ENN29_11130 [Candidatus Hydrogenedentes bacterium]|mgnify:CR=1 FL=1|nr:hypothetical protein [Candidatus Hydrogenedentota bacterium]
MMSDFIEAYKAIGDEEEDFDIAFWQAQGPDAIFDAAMQLILDAELIRNGDAEEPRLDRTVESYQRL